jgi:hypothetical protein
MNTKSKFCYARILAATLITGIATQAQADISVSQTVIPNADILLANPPPGESAKIGMRILEIDAEIPAYQKMNTEYNKPTILTHKLNLRQLTFTYDYQVSEDEYKPDEVYNISYGLEYVTPVNQDWMLIGFGSLAASSDFEGDTDEQDFIVEGGAIAVYQFKNGWDLGIGPVYTHAFGNPEFILAPYAKYNYKGSFIFDMRIPKYITAQYVYNEKFMIGAALRVTGSAYHVNPDGTTEEGTIGFSDATAGIEATWRMYEDLMLDFSVAQTIDRTLEIQDNSGDVTADRELDNTTLYKMGLRLML